MQPRTLEAKLLEAAGQYPVVTLAGPRQSGKSTLCRYLFPDRPFLSLENLDTRARAIEDPRAFLGSPQDGAVLHEVQRAPELLSYLQEVVDLDDRPGRFILTGSQNFGLVQGVTQSLAGRTALLRLLPMSHQEVRGFGKSSERLLDALFAGGYPRIHDRGLSPSDWLADYTASYIERDVRQLLKVGDLEAFRRFLQICAGRSGQLVNLSAMATDTGITHNTARSWLSVLEASYILQRVPVYHRNLNKRLIKAPKLYFLDTGLLCYLLGLLETEHLRHHPLRGAIFETWVVSELLKGLAHRRAHTRLSFFRDRKGFEVDALLEHGPTVTAIEIKSGQTIASDWFKGLRRFSELAKAEPMISKVHSVLVYGGDEAQNRSDAQVVPWNEVEGILDG